MNKTHKKLIAVLPNGLADSIERLMLTYPGVTREDVATIDAAPSEVPPQVPLPLTPEIFSAFSPIPAVALDPEDCACYVACPKAGAFYGPKNHDFTKPMKIKETGVCGPTAHTLFAMGTGIRVEMNVGLVMAYMYLKRPAGYQGLGPEQVFIDWTVRHKNDHLDDCKPGNLEWAPRSAQDRWPPLAERMANVGRAGQRRAGVELLEWLIDRDLFDE